MCEEGEFDDPDGITIEETEREAEEELADLKAEVEAAREEQAKMKEKLAKAESGSSDIVAELGKVSGPTSTAEASTMLKAKTDELDRLTSELADLKSQE